MHLSNAPVELYCSIIADNTANGGSTANFGPIPQFGSQLRTLGYNLTDSNNAVVTTSLDGPGDMTDTDPELDPIANLGGWSCAHTSAVGSPVRNGGDPQVCLIPGTDALGGLRIRPDISPRIDIGALETGGFTLDSDSDGIPNWWEELYGFDPADPSDAAEDPDQDLATNLDEFNNGTDPFHNDLPEPPELTPLEILSFGISDAATSTWELSFTSDPGERYFIQISFDLQGWADIQLVSAAASGNVTTTEFDSTLDRAFFRVVHD